MHHVEDCDGTKMKAIKHFFPHCKTQPEEGWKVNVTNSSPAWAQRRGLVCPDVVPPLKECAATINIRINAPFIYFFKSVFNVLPRLTASRTCCKRFYVQNPFIHHLQSKVFQFSTSRESTTLPGGSIPDVTVGAGVPPLDSSEWSLFFPSDLTLGPSSL